MHHDEKLKSKLIHYIQDAYGMENQIVEVLEKQVKDTKQYPMISQRIQEHLEATKQHRARMEQRLQAYDEKPSAIKGLMTNLMGNMQGALGGAQSDTLAMQARNDFVVENFEIASYALLISTAELYGDVETVRACEMNLRDELVMREWLQNHVVEAGFLSLQQDGINVPQQAFQQAQQTVMSLLQGGGMPGMRQGTMPQQQQSGAGGPVL